MVAASERLDRGLKPSIATYAPDMLTA